jgi:ABC-type molybdate transport system ATPase subunit
VATEEYKQLLDERHKAVMSRLAEMHEEWTQTTAYVRAQNGEVARLTTRVSVLEERNPNKASLVISSVVSGLITGLGVFLSGRQP